ncbi:hypothetical protein GW17_00058157 [Ensete ventricosum]|nr:hypothetical protein GW17_00058157 [Ensete ventricosum]
MHPLRFPNSGIRAKVFMRKIGSKLRVMRLNCIELLYVLVAAISSESRHYLRGESGHMHAVCMQRWLAMARPPAGATGHGLATCKGRPTAARPPARGDHPWAWPAVASPQGVTARGQPCHQQRQRRRSQGCLPLGRAATDRKGQPSPA